MRKKIAILGSTGSIGESTLEVIKKDKKNFEIILLTANNNYKKLIKQAKEWEEVITKINNAKDLNIDDSFINTAVDELPEDPFDETTWDHWTSKINKKTGLKGKDLFMPLRLILTGKSHGPELKYLLPLFDRDEILQKLGKI